MQEISLFIFPFESTERKRNNGVDVAKYDMTDGSFR